MKNALICLLAILFLGCQETLIQGFLPAQGNLASIEQAKLEQLHLNYELSTYNTLNHVRPQYKTITLDNTKNYQITIDYQFRVSEQSQIFQLLEINHCAFSMPKFSIIKKKSKKVIFDNVDLKKSYALPPVGTYLLRATIYTAKAEKYELSIVSWLGTKQEKPAIASICDSSISDSLIIFNHDKIQTVHLKDGSLFLDSKNQLLCGRQVTTEEFDYNCRHWRSMSAPTSRCNYTTSEQNSDHYTVLIQYITRDSVEGSIICKHNNAIYEEVNLYNCHEAVLNQAKYIPSAK